MIYLDNAATSWPKPEQVYLAVDRALRECGNAGRGVNSMSLSASRVLFETRALLAKLFNIKNPERIVFTQNVTEATNLGLKGILKQGDHVLISSLEHNAVVRTLEALKNIDVTYSITNCTTEGILDLTDLENKIKPNTKLICMTHASNVLGTILPIKEIGKIAKKNGLYFMVDGAQTAGVLPIDVFDMEIDLLGFTGHKGLLGPQGTGGLYIREGISINPLIHGGTGSHSSLLKQPEILPEGLESGTRNIPALAGLLEGVKYCLEKNNEIRNHELFLIKKLIEGIKKIPNIIFYGTDNPNLRVGLITINFINKDASLVGTILDRQFGIITRTGIHCSPLAHEVIGTSNQGALRISIGPFTTENEINILLNALEVIGGEL